jgi:glycerophosphoryl diester phosphodiesterase
MAGVPSWHLPFWIAHRGAGKLAPENTLAAFREGARHGYCAFECDVKLSADGVPFLLHDATLERTTTSQGSAAACAWSELSRLDAGSWHGAEFAGEPPPSLEGIAAFCRAGGHALNIEIKPTPGTERATGHTVALAARQLWCGQAGWPLMSSFQVESLEAAQAAAPELPRALLVDELWTGWLDAARRLQCVALVANHRLYQPALLAQIHQAGMVALAYTVNDGADAARLKAMGLDGLITDAVDRLGPGAASGKS